MTSRTVPLFAAAAAFAVVPAAVLPFVGPEEVDVNGWIHVAGVALGAGLATIAALALTLTGARTRDGYVVAVGCALALMAATLCLHGVATPGVLLDENGAHRLAGGASLLVGAAILALSAIPALRRPSAVRPLLLLLALGLTLVVGLGLTALAWPGLVPSAPEPRSPATWTVLAAGLVLYGVLAWRALRTVRLTHRRADFAVALGLAWLAVALSAALLFDDTSLGAWLGHGFEILALAAVGIPVALDVRRGKVLSKSLLGDARGADVVAEEEASFGSHVRALLAALAAKDAYTEEHTRRVALRAVQVGEELGLAAERLRDLAVGGLLHDLGKLSVPERILRKPGPLTDDEFGVVTRHVHTGVALLRQLGGFSGGTQRLVRGHHERLDGSGYPKSVPGDPIPLEVCILAVCDVYDALITERVYRPAWTHERALAYLYEGAGRLFDAGCVEALDRVLARERSEALAVAV